MSAIDLYDAAFGILCRLLGEYSARGIWITCKAECGTPCRLTNELRQNYQIMVVESNCEPQIYGTIKTVVPSLILSVRPASQASVVNGS